MQQLYAGKCDLLRRSFLRASVSNWQRHINRNDRFPDLLAGTIDMREDFSYRKHYADRFCKSCEHELDFYYSYKLRSRTGTSTDEIIQCGTGVLIKLFQDEIKLLMVALDGIPMTWSSSTPGTKRIAQNNQSGAICAADS